MKYALLLLLASATMFTARAQGEKKPVASPPATATGKTASGTVITIAYGQPSVKGRTIGVNLEPKKDTIWRLGANDATTFMVSKDVTVEGKPLPAGTYSLFTIMHGSDWTIVFNKTAKQWGAYEYKADQDALRVKVKGGKASPFAEKLLFNVSDKGQVSFAWGDHRVAFNVK